MRAAGQGSGGYRRAAHPVLGKEVWLKRIPFLENGNSRGKHAGAELAYLAP